MIFWFFFRRLSVPCQCSCGTLLQTQPCSSRRWDPPLPFVSYSSLSLYNAPNLHYSQAAYHYSRFRDDVILLIARSAQLVNHVNATHVKMLCLTQPQCDTIGLVLSTWLVSQVWTAPPTWPLIACVWVSLMRFASRFRLVWLRPSHLASCYGAASRPSHNDTINMREAMWEKRSSAKTGLCPFYISSFYCWLFRRNSECNCLLLLQHWRHIPEQLPPFRTLSVCACKLPKFWSLFSNFAAFRRHFQSNLCCDIRELQLLWCLRFLYCEMESVHGRVRRK